ncbi:HAMP domain-containing sensor histidine kinase [Bacillus sp. DX1.1]|uniref:sensor histidine kinase n=1 Tax=Bacillus sp. DX1.1 TaxID=3055866 RepID=UPI0025A13B27|nr:HAMP domain-containing sensor histidine kinase [Bacillus sp. DX1.1]MDM5152612.1 HAMP domain-containing sensor histidine kinase [Bacillus sp. DX1.1]
MKFNIKVASIIAIFSSCMLIFITAILLYKGHEHLMMLHITDSKELIQHFDMALRETALWSLGLLLIVILISSLLIARTLTRPIQEMNHFALKLVRGDRHLNISYTINDQIGQLGQSLIKLDETLSDYELRRKEMTQDLAHEIRNPLASIKSYLSAFEDGVWTPTPDRLQACVEEINRLIILVGELDTLNDINSSTFKVIMKEQQIANLIENSVIALASELLEKEIQVELDLDKTIHGQVDALRLNQILHNIIKNAMCHVQKDGTIFIKLFKKSSDYIILVHDNGVGMDEETSKRIFERNYRGKIDILAMVLV